MGDSTTSTTDSASASAPAAVTTATQTILEQLEAAGKAELEALKPQVAAIVRKFVAAYEDAHMTGLVGKVERHVLDAVIDSALGPAPEPTA